MRSDNFSLVSRIHHTEHGPTWRNEPFSLNFVLLTREPHGSELLSICKWAQHEGLVHPRVISPQTLEWSSIFQPRFFDAVRGPHDGCIRVLNRSDTPEPRVDSQSWARFWLQSVMFLAGVTLSAAIIQGRWSEGTFASKLDRLWNAGEMALAGVAPELSELDLFQSVRFLADRTDMPALERWLRVRTLFEEVISRLSIGTEASTTTMRAESRQPIFPERFGFVEMLKLQIPGIRAVIVYGSSITSAAFSDYDVLVVVDNPRLVLSLLHNSSPRWNGKELNLGVYSPEELWRMQLLSGDNLAEYGVCMHGETELPSKPVDTLLTRNLSFGMVRLRQQLGMICQSLDPRCNGPDRSNLYQYFVKIPANIAKGTFGATGRRLSKEDVHQWLIKRCGFNTEDEQRSAASGDPSGPLARSSVATSNALRVLNEQLRIVEPVEHS